MFLTLYYMAATFIQSWKLRSVSTKLSNHISKKMSVVFYNIQDEGNASSIVPASSELCTNNTQARIADVLWHQGSQRGVALLPKQHLHLGPWVSFPSPPNLIPFDFGENNDLALDERETIYLLLETDLHPQVGKDNGILMVENFGKLIAWKVDSRFAVLMKADLHHFSELIATSFMQECLLINDHLPLIRIESVSIDGEPQPFEAIKNHSKKEFISRAMRLLTPEQWEKHIIGLRNFGILASQASEFEYNKNRTEGKTGIVKPDLIPTKSIDDPSKTSPKKSGHLKNDLTEIAIVLKKPSPKTSPRTSPLKLIPEIDFTQEIAKTSSKVIEEPEKIESSNSALNTNDLIPTVSSRHNGAPRPMLVRSKGSLIVSKPPNVLVYSEGIATRDCVITTLKEILEKDMYTIYALTTAQVKTKIWIDNTVLLVVCGYVTQDIGAILTEFFLKGGKMLSLCSDVLHIVLPTFRTHAEVREHELVQFSYGRWQKVKMMHHIFCYQPSPVKKHFSTDSDEPQIVQKKPILVCPRSVEVIDLQNNKHSLQVQVLGTEETWNTPSLMLATNGVSGGKAIFSQVHLEVDPNIYENDEAKYLVLKQSDKARIEIFTDLLSSHLGIVVVTMDSKEISKLYTSAFFLGDHKIKYELLDKLKPNMIEENTLKSINLIMKFCGKGVEPPKATATLLPILINSCPEDFSTVEYFDNLKSEEIGRLVIYAPAITSSMSVLSNLTLGHGLAVVPRRQTNGMGRNDNQWLSPVGCAMFSLQLHIPLMSPLGQKLSLIQHLIGTAMVDAILNLDGYEELDIRLKWPNDIYANGRTKIGGIIVNSQIEASQAICNIGCAINLNNSTPTTCINDLIKENNSKNNTTLANIGYEKLLALMFTEIERLFEIVQSDNLKHLYQRYEELWLHSDTEVLIIDKNGHQCSTKIIGIDDYGYLLVQKGHENVSVHPDGNSFDMLQGLIITK